jgi:hypothetical protein
MTSTAEMSGHAVDSARGMRELVRARAAESERMRTLTGAIVEGEHVGVQSCPGLRR